MFFIFADGEFVNGSVATRYAYRYIILFLFVIATACNRHKSK